MKGEVADPYKTLNNTTYIFKKRKQFYTTEAPRYLNWGALSPESTPFTSYLKAFKEGYQAFYTFYT